MTVPAPDADRGNLVILRSWGGQAVVRVLRGDEMPPSAAGVTAYLPRAAGWTGHIGCPPLTSAELELEAALAAAADLPPTFSRRHAA